jgi:hypothetical protein
MGRVTRDIEVLVAVITLSSVDGVRDFYTNGI